MVGLVLPLLSLAHVCRGHREKLFEEIFQVLQFLTLFLATCGDGKLRGTEACDDGNKVSGDGCSATCGLEKGWDCPTPGKKCIDIDECALWNCIDPFNGGKYPSTYVPHLLPPANTLFSCVDSRDIVTPRPAINTRVCTCPLGFYLDGTDQTKITRSVTLTGSAKFPGCRGVHYFHPYLFKNLNFLSNSKNCTKFPCSPSIFRSQRMYPLQVSRRFQPYPEDLLRRFY